MPGKFEQALAGLVVMLATALALAGLWYFLRGWWAPDGCLDSGGAFDYDGWKCAYADDGEIYRFKQVWFFQLHAPWSAIAQLQTFRAGAGPKRRLS